MTVVDPIGRSLEQYASAIARSGGNSAVVSSNELSANQLDAAQIPDADGNPEITAEELASYLSQLLAQSTETKEIAGQEYNVITLNGDKYVLFEGALQNAEQLGVIDHDCNIIDGMLKLVTLRDTINGLLNELDTLDPEDKIRLAVFGAVASYVARGRYAKSKIPQIINEVMAKIALAMPDLASDRLDQIRAALEIVMQEDSIVAVLTRPRGQVVPEADLVAFANYIAEVSAYGKDNYDSLYQRAVGLGDLINDLPIAPVNIRAEFDAITGNRLDKIKETLAFAMEAIDEAEATLAENLDPEALAILNESRGKVCTETGEDQWECVPATADDVPAFPDYIPSGVPLEQMFTESGLQWVKWSLWNLLKVVDPNDEPVLPSDLISSLSYEEAEAAGQPTNWLDSMAVKYHLLPHLSLYAGGSYNSLEDLEQVGEPSSQVTLGANLGLDWSTEVGNDYVLGLSGGGGYEYQGLFGANNNPHFHNGHLSLGVSGLSGDDPEQATSYIPNFNFKLSGIFLNNDRSELNPWGEPTGNTLSLAGILSQPIYTFGNGHLALEAPWSSEFGWYEPFGEGSAPTPDVDPNFMRHTIGGGLKLNIDVATLMLGYRHVWEMPQRIFMGTNYGFQTYEGNGGYLGLGINSGDFMMRLMGSYTYMDTWYPHVWDASLFGKYDFGPASFGLGVYGGQENHFVTHSTNVGGEIGAYDIAFPALSTDLFETSMDIALNGGYTWLADDMGEGFNVGGVLRFNFGPKPNHYDLDEVNPGYNTANLNADMMQDMTAAEPDALGDVYADHAVQQFMGVPSMALTKEQIERYAEAFRAGKLDVNYVMLTPAQIEASLNINVEVEVNEEEVVEGEEAAEEEAAAEEAAPAATPALTSDNMIEAAEVALGDVAPVPAELDDITYVMIAMARREVAQNQGISVDGATAGTNLASAAIRIAEMAYPHILDDNNPDLVDNEVWDANGLGSVYTGSATPQASDKFRFVEELKAEIQGGVVGKATMALLSMMLDDTLMETMTIENITTIYGIAVEKFPPIVEEQEEVTAEEETEETEEVEEEAPVEGEVEGGVEIDEEEILAPAN